MLTGPLEIVLQGTLGGTVDRQLGVFVAHFRAGAAKNTTPLPILPFTETHSTHKRNEITVLPELLFIGFYSHGFPTKIGS